MWHHMGLISRTACFGTHKKSSNHISQKKNSKRNELLLISAELISSRLVLLSDSSMTWDIVMLLIWQRH